MGISWERSQESLEKQIMQGTTPGSHTRGEADRKQHGWTTFFNGLDSYTLDKTLVYSEDRVKWRQLVHGVAKPRNEDG